MSSNALDLVRGATLGFTNLEVNLLDGEPARAAGARPAPRWIFAPAISHRACAPGIRRRVAGQQSFDGFWRRRSDVDVGALDAAGIVSRRRRVGSCRGPCGGVIGRGARRVAVVAVTASASDQARASASQQRHSGTAGVSPLLYDAAITVDAATYRTLAQSVNRCKPGRRLGIAN